MCYLKNRRSGFSFMSSAETVNQAKDACELIDIEYEDLPAVVSPSKAIQNDSPNIWEEIPNNICFEWELGNKDETEKANTTY